MEPLTITIIVIILIIVIGVIVACIRIFTSYAKKLFGDDTDPHTYVDARKLPRSSKKSKT